MDKEQESSFLASLPHMLIQASLLVNKGVRAISFEGYSKEFVRKYRNHINATLSLYQSGDAVGFVIYRGASTMVGYAANETMLRALQGVMVMDQGGGEASKMADAFIGLMLGYSARDVHLFVTK